MSINIHDGSSFNEVSNVYAVPSYSTYPRKSARVWVHNGTKYMMVKGRLLEVEWESDLSTWGGVSWGGSNNREPYHNKLKSMLVLDNGDLLGVVDYVINNNSTNQYSTNRYSLIKLSSDTGSISAFSTYTSWSSWNAVSGYRQTYQPIGIIRCGDYYVAYSEHGIFYVFNSGGTYKSKYENETWHTDGSSKYIYESNDYGIKCCFQDVNSCIYYSYYDQNKNDTDSSSYMTSIYRAGISGSSLYTPRRHYAGEREARYYGFCTNVLADGISKKAVANFSGRTSSYLDKLVVFSTSYSYSSTTTDVSALCSITDGVDGEGEYPIFIKDGYVYTINGFDGDVVYKRNLTDLSLIWSAKVPELSGGYRECSNSHQVFPERDGGFILPNGCTVYPDGKIVKEKQLFTDNGGTYQNETIPSFCFNETLGIGYMMNYSDGDYSSTEYSSTPFCKVIKLKEVKK